MQEEQLTHNWSLSLLLLRNDSKQSWQLLMLKPITLISESHPRKILKTPCIYPEIILEKSKILRVDKILMKSLEKSYRNVLS